MEVKREFKKPKIEVEIDLSRKYTYRELSEVIGRPVPTIRLMVKDGRIPSSCIIAGRKGAGKKSDFTKLELGRCYTRREAQELLKVAPQTLDTMIEDGRLTEVETPTEKLIRFDG